MNSYRILRLWAARLIIPAAMLVLPGCGQKGPLYLPQDNPGNPPQDTQTNEQK
ncbi:MAG: lipoprotein [Gammaproteobacteria bacterium]